MAATCAWAQLAIAPPSPTPFDVVRLRYTHVGCTNPDSVRVLQAAGAISVQVDRTFGVDCGTTAGYFEDFTLGRFPAGDFSAQLIVNPPPGTLGPSQLLGPVAFSVAPYPQTGSLHPHDNYEDMWWDPDESGWGLSVFQSGERLVLVWATYGLDGGATWFIVPSGAWARNGSDNALRFSGAVYQTKGPPWPGTFDPSAVTVTAVGVAGFTPRGATQAQFDYAINGVSKTKPVQRMRF